MIKFRAKDVHGDLLGFGLSRANCVKLLQGEPILIDLAEANYARGTGPDRIVIFAGESEDDMTLKLIEAGVVTPETDWHGGHNAASDG